MSGFFLVTWAHLIEGELVVELLNDAVILGQEWGQQPGGGADKLKFLSSRGRKRPHGLTLPSIRKPWCMGLSCSEGGCLNAVKIL